ncbi:hypothetical protein [Microvirga roseola]|uniref:hypothetical protein n=1 Tax=Microvirga roseola TaxID=2883126 RepID=UPI001E3E00D4|nr:hypothetical protein [Microvirga roseola]
MTGRLLPSAGLHHLCRGIDHHQDRPAIPHTSLDEVSRIEDTDVLKTDLTELLPECRALLEAASPGLRPELPTTEAALAELLAARRWAARLVGAVLLTGPELHASTSRLIGAVLLASSVFQARTITWELLS